jgi:hypothetical protein
MSNFVRLRNRLYVKPTPIPNFQTINYSFTPAIEENNYILSTAENSWNIQRNAQDNDFLFEVRSGDKWATDASLSRPYERAEISKVETANFGETYWVAYDFKLLGAPTNAQWLYLGQWHATPDPDDVTAQPIYKLELVDTGWRIRTYGTTQDPLVDTVNPTTHYQSGPFNLNQWYRFVARFIFSPTAAELSVWLNENQIVNATNFPMGYQDVVGPYWKVGIYRYETTETFKVRVANLSVGKTDLSGRITSPPPLPVEL